MTTAGGNDKEKPSGARAKTFLTSNVNTTKVPVTGHSSSLNQEARPRTSSPRLSRVYGTQFIDNLCNSRIPSLEATGINQKFLARHTTDQSLQHASQVGDFNLPKRSTPRAEWLMWSLPPPDASETRHQWPQSSGQHPSVVDNQTAVQSRWQTFGTQPWREANHLNSTPQEQKSLNHIDPRYASRKKTFSRLRSSENLSSKTGATLINSCNTHAGMPSTYEPNWHYSSNNFYESQTNSSIYDGTAVRDKPPTSTLPTVKSHPPEMCPNVTAPITELQSTVTINTHSFRSHSYPSRVVPENGQERSFTSRGEGQRNGAVISSPEFSSMREPEKITKAQLEAARKKREMKEQRESEAREMKEREERERREREEREREERKMRERQEREIREIREREEREKKERKKIEPKENDERQTKWFGGERAPVQESPRWQCEHYQRRCLVKFPCCGIFYPCHRCHNTSGACDTDDRKTNNATHVKCGICGHEEEVSGFVLTIIPKNCFVHSYCA